MMILLLYGCLSDQNEAHVEFLQKLVNENITKGYLKVYEETQVLDEQIKDYCIQPTNDLTQLQSVWWSTRESFKQLDYAQFGPYFEPPERAGPQLDFWPLRSSSIDDVLLGDLNLEESVFHSYGASIKGFPALEYLLFGSVDTNSARYCEYIQAIGNDLVFQSNILYNYWNPSDGEYLNKRLSPDGSNVTTDSINDVRAELVNQIGHTLADIRTLKLQKPMGLQVGSPQPDLLESRYSARSLMDIHDNIIGIKRLFLGLDTTLGLVHDPTLEGIDFSSEFETRADQCLTHILQLHQSGSLEETILIEPEQVEILSDEIGYLQQLVQEDIILAMSLWLTFNDSDGD
jgi:predicted lipoprotein